MTVIGYVARLKNYIELRSFILMVIIVLDFFNLSFFYPLFNTLVYQDQVFDKFGFSPETIYGILISAYPFGQFLGAPILGKLSDIFGYRKLLTITLLFTCFSLLICASGISISSVPMIMMGRFLGGFMAGNLTIAYAILADCNLTSKKVSQFALIPLSCGVGFTLGSSLAGIFEQNAFYIIITSALISLMHIPLILWILPKSAEKQENKLSKRFSSLFTAYSLFKNYKIFISLLIFLFMITSNLLFSQYIGSFAIKKLDIKTVELGYLYANIGISIAFAHIFITRRLIYYFRPEQALIGALFLMTILELSFLISPNITFLFIQTSLLMFACAVAYTNSMVCISNFGGKELQGELMGSAVSLQSLAGFLPALLVGILSSLFYEIPLIIASLFSTASLSILLLFMKKLKDSSSLEVC